MNEKWDYKGVQMSVLVYLCAMIQEAEKDRHLPLAPTAQKYWNYLYKKVEGAKRADYIGSIIARGAAHIRRLQPIFCLIDRNGAVTVEHLKAALAIWEYSVELRNTSLRDTAGRAREYSGRSRRRDP